MNQSLSSRSAFAAAVSRVVRENVMRPLPSGTSPLREGVRVSRGALADTASINVDIDLPTKAERIADAIDEALTEHGYTVTRNPYSDTILYVAKENA